MILKTIPLNKIDTKNHTFQYRAHIFNESLAHALQKTGVCDPLYLCQKGTAYPVLDGFKRLHALKQYFSPSFPVPIVLISETEFNYQSHLAIILKQNGQAPLPFSEKVAAYLLLKRTHPDIDSYQILQDLQLPREREYAPVYRCFELIPETWYRYFTDHNVPGRRINIICCVLDLNKCTELLKMNFGINRLEQLIVMIAEISKRDNISVQEITDSVFKDNNQSMSPDQQFQHIRRQRYPFITEYENRISMALKELQVPRNLVVQCDRKGERPGLELILSLRNDNDVDTVTSWFNASKTSLNKLLKDRLEL